MKMRDAWVLRLKEESKEPEMVGDYYLTDDEDIDTEYDFLTNDVNEAQLVYDKEKQITVFKKHEEFMKNKFGEHAICNFGYSNIMKNFEWVEVEVEELEVAE